MPARSSRYHWQWPYPVEARATRPERTRKTERRRGWCCLLGTGCRPYLLGWMHGCIVQRPSHSKLLRGGPSCHCRGSIRCKISCAAVSRGNQYVQSSAPGRFTVLIGYHVCLYSANNRHRKQTLANTPRHSLPRRRTLSPPKSWSRQQWARRCRPAQRPPPRCRGPWPSAPRAAAR